MNSYRPMLILLAILIPVICERKQFFEMLIKDASHTTAFKFVQSMNTPSPILAIIDGI